MKQTSLARKGETVIFLRGGQEGLRDGIPATVQSIYPGGSQLDLIVYDGAGLPNRFNVVSHLSDRDDLGESHVRNGGLWQTIEEHHELYEAEEAARLKRIDAQRKNADKKTKQEVLS